MAAAQHRHPVGRNKCEQFAFVCHIERIEAKNFTRAFDFFADRNLRFLQSNPDLGLLGDFTQGTRQSAPRGIPQDMNVWRDIQHASTKPLSGAVSLAISVSNSNPSRTDMMAMPWTAISPLTMILSPDRARLG